MSKPAKPYWAKLLLAGFPVLRPELSGDDIPEGDPHWMLWGQIHAHADDEDVDLVEAGHRFLKGALGERRFAEARRAMEEGDWDERIQFMCRKAALMLCRYHDGWEKCYTLAQLDSQVKGLLMTEAELLEAQTQQQAQIAWLQAAAPYNSIPC